MAFIKKTLIHFRTFLLKSLLFCLTLYQTLLSALVGPCCRFEPSCSQYARDALKTHGCMKGGYLTLRRLLRCHPWHAGGMDAVP